MVASSLFAQGEVVVDGSAIIPGLLEKSFRHGHHGHGGAHFGFFFGAPLFWDPYPYYYPYRPPVYIERQPQTYIQQSSNYWYYCRNPSGYYPYVQNCPMGWMQVVPQTPPQ